MEVEVQGITFNVSTELKEGSENVYNCDVLVLKPISETKETKQIIPVTTYVETNEKDEQGNPIMEAKIQNKESTVRSIEVTTKSVKFGQFTIYGKMRSRDIKTMAREYIVSHKNFDKLKIEIDGNN